MTSRQTFEKFSNCHPASAEYGQAARGDLWPLKANQSADQGENVHLVIFRFGCVCLFGHLLDVTTPNRGIFTTSVFS
jgi:hypothetical protein